MKINRIIFFLIFSYLLIYGYTHIAIIANFTIQTSTLIANQLFPSLFFFMLFITLAQKLNILDVFNYGLFKLTKKNQLPTLIYLFSILSGYPTNAKIIANAKKQKQLSLNASQKLICIAHHASFSFVVYVVGELYFHSLKIGLLLELAHVLSTFIFFLFSFRQINLIPVSLKNYEDHFKHHDFLILFTNSIKECIFAFLFIYTSMLFSYIFFESLPSFLFKEYLRGLFEFSSGCLSMASSSLPLLLRLLFIEFYLSFGGLSIFIQLLQFDQFAFFPYLKFRFIHVFLSQMILLILFKLTF